MTDAWPLLAPGDKIVAIIAFGRGFLVELPPRSSWLSQEMSEILPSDGVIFYTDGSLCEGRAGAGVFSDTLDITKESYALGSSKRRYLQFSPVLQGCVVGFITERFL
jgi:hypothetical protein